MSNDDVVRDFQTAAVDNLGRLLDAASTAVNAELMVRLAAAGFMSIRPAHVSVFAGLQPGGIQITALAAHAGMSRQAMSVLVREVESLGYLRVTADPTDRRALRVELTELGERFCRAAIDISAQINAQFEQLWTPAELAALRTRLREAAATFSAAEGQAS